MRRFNEAGTDQCRKWYGPRVLQSRLRGFNEAGTDQCRKWTKVESAFRYGSVPRFNEAGALISAGNA